MGNFNKGKKFGGSGGNRSFGGDRGGNRGFGGGRDRERPEMHKVICSDCGNNCEVPFRPTGDKPVFCSDCFKNKRSDSPRESRGDNKRFGDRNSKPRFDNKRPFQGGGQDNKAQFEILNTKLDRILKMLNPEATKETEKIIDKPKHQKFKKLIKEVDTVSLKKAIDKTKEKKPIKKITKKVEKKKTIKKITPKKKK